jgi:hypothetical protein
MAIIETLRLALKKYTSGGDPHPTRAEFNTMIDALENNVGMFSQGITSARPAAGKIGREYWDTEANRKYYDDGTAWRDLNPNGGGGAGAKVTPGINGIEGVSARSARADHTHRIDLVTGSAHGAMSAADKAKLDTATSAATGNALVQRDANARVSVNTPTSATHATTKAYVDGLITEAANYVDAQVGPGLTVTRHEPLDFAGYDTRGDIWSVDLVNKTVVIGNVSITRTASPNITIAGGDVAHTILGQFIPTSLKDLRPTSDVAGILNMSNMIGAGQYERIQTFVNQTTGQIGVRGDGTAGTLWRTGGSVNVSFTYLIDPA